MFSVAMSFAGIGYSLREFGASAFLIRSPSIESRHIAFAFGLTLSIGFGLGILMLTIAKPLAAFFGQQDIQVLIQILSINFFLLPFGSVQNALIQRAMHFDVVARINILATTVSVCVSMALAWFGYGAHSLAWGAVALSTTSACLSSLWGPGPRLIWPRIRGASELVLFGAQNTALTVLWEVSTRYPEFILGKLRDFTSAGIMSRGSGLVNNVNDLLIKGMYPVALSYFSQIKRENGDPVHAHIKIATLVTGLGWPAFFGLAAFAEPLTLVLYGNRWIEIVWPVRILCLELALLLPFCFQYQVVMAKGGMEKQVRATTIAVGFRIIGLTIGANWGPIGAAISLVISQMIYTVLVSRMVWPSIGVTWSDYWGVIRANIAILAVTIGTTTAVTTIGRLSDASPVQVVFLLAPIACAGVVCGYAILGHPLVVETKRMFVRK